MSFNNRALSLVITRTPLRQNHYSHSIKMTRDIILSNVGADLKLDVVSPNKAEKVFIMYYFFNQFWVKGVLLTFTIDLIVLGVFWVHILGFYILPVYLCI